MEWLLAFAGSVATKPNQSRIESNWTEPNYGIHEYRIEWNPPLMIRFGVAIRFSGFGGLHILAIFHYIGISLSSIDEVRRHTWSLVYSVQATAISWCSFNTLPIPSCIKKLLGPSIALPSTVVLTSLSPSLNSSNSSSIPPTLLSAAHHVNRQLTYWKRYSITYTRSPNINVLGFADVDCGTDENGGTSFTGVRIDDQQRPCHLVLSQTILRLVCNYGIRV